MSFSRQHLHLPPAANLFFVNSSIKNAGRRKFGARDQLSSRVTGMLRTGIPAEVSAMCAKRRYKPLTRRGRSLFWGLPIICPTEQACAPTETRTVSRQGRVNAPDKAPAAAKIFLDISFHKRIGERCSKQKECFFLLTEFGKCDILLPTNGLCQNNPPV